MSKAQFTPGQWSDIPANGAPAGYSYTVLQNGNAIADIPDQEHDEQIARLIAAAPNYHRIIEALADWLDEGDNLPRPESLMPGSESETFAQAIRAALAKAKGE